MTKAIFFDYHGVLDKRTYFAMLEMLVKQTFKTGDFESYRLGFIEKYAALVNAYASGELLPEHFWSKLLHDGYDLEILAQARDYILTVEKNKEIISQINKLKEKFEFGVISDVSDDKLDMIKLNWQLGRYFKYKIFSCESGFNKIDPEFYREMSVQSGLKPHEIFYVDENPQNVAKAKQLGFEGVAFIDGLNLVRYFEI